MRDNLLIIHAPDLSSNTYKEGDLVTTNDWITSCGCDFELPIHSDCKVHLVKNDSEVYLRPIDIDIDLIYEELDYDCFEEDEDMWDEAYYRRDVIEESLYLVNIEDITLVENFINPLLPPTKEVEKKSRLHNLGDLLRKKTRELVKRLSGFFKKDRSWSTPILNNTDQGWSSAHGELSPYPTEYCYTITNNLTTIRQSYSVEF